MSDQPVPTTYAAWRHCIEVDCGLTLSAAYIAERIAALNSTREHHTQQFIRRWGEAHRQRVIAWFHQAARELAR